MLCKLNEETESIVLIGMPGAGKTTVGRRLAAALGRPFVDLDARIAETTGRTPAAWLRSEGEAAFRAAESAALRSAVTEHGIILACGGGVVTVAENAAPLRQSGWIVWLERELRKLDISGRPLSQSGDVAALYAARAPLYAALADVRVENNASPEEAVRAILEAWRRRRMQA